MGGRVRAEGQANLGRFILELVADDPGLYPRNTAFDIDVADRMQVFGGIDHHGSVHRLPAHGCPGPAGQDRQARRLAQVDGGDDVLERPGYHHADRQLPIVRSLASVKRARRCVEPDLGAGLRCQLLAQTEQDVQVKGDRRVLGHGAKPSRSSARSRLVLSSADRQRRSAGTVGGTCPALYVCQEGTIMPFHLRAVGGYRPSCMRV